MSGRNGFVDVKIYAKKIQDKSDDIEKVASVENEKLTKKKLAKSPEREYVGPICETECVYTPNDADDEHFAECEKIATGKHKTGIMETIKNAAKNLRKKR